MSRSYFDDLQWIKEAVEMLQKHPVPDNDPDKGELLERILQSSLKSARASITSMLLSVQPYGHLWVGEPNDPLRRGMILAKEWDRLMKGI